MKPIDPVGIAMLVALTFSGCYSYSERPSGPLPRYSDYQPLSPSADDVLQCPTPRGVFQNTSEIGQSMPGLESHFSVPGFQMHPRHVIGADPDGGQVSISMSAIHLLGGSEAGTRKPYRTRPGERVTLVIRPLEQSGWFHITARGTLGATGAGNGRLVLYQGADGLTGRRCEGGALNSYSKLANGRIERYESLWVDPATGDMLMAYRADLDRGKISYRYKRIAD